MDIKQFDLALWQGHWYNPITWFIQQRTSTNLTHGSILLGRTIRVYGVEGDQIEAIGGGVQLTKLASYGDRKRMILRYQQTISPHVQDQMLSWLISKIGCKYEWKSFLGYIFGIKTSYLDDPNQFVCTEIYSEMFSQNGINVWGEDEPVYIYPSYFSQNNLFRRVL